MSGSNGGKAKEKALNIIVRGRVQGVGFRPFIFQIARVTGIKGTVQNNMDGVNIHAEGKEQNLQRFIEKIKHEPPRLSRVDQVLVKEEDFRGFQDFTIIPSERTGKNSLVIPVDAATCDDCLREMKDPNDFRYNYPFINCTQCGPRYTIIRDLPYDRPYTSMSSFEMCEKCKEEYEDPTNRRHHAQPIACPECGPSLTLMDLKRNVLAENHEAILQAADFLESGKIVAIKGLGGYHLFCDASDEKAIQRLRDRKNRPKRPLAIMAKNMEAIEKVCYVSETEKKWLQSPEAPIVILKKKNNQLPENLAEGFRTLGFMLPYTPLHHLLFLESSLEYVVATSANPSGLPLLYKDEEAIDYLADIADFILTHNREILHPIDDSVIQIVDDQLIVIRRARGFVPDPISTEKNVDKILALGSQQKNTFAFGRYEQIFVGPHIGDLNYVEVINHFERELKHFERLLKQDSGYRAVAIDMHPNFSNRAFAEALRIPIVEVQHHHAHHAACMEENHLEQPCFGLILDGTGYGLDGNIWGFECLYGDQKSFERLGHLAYSPLPGGEKAIREPWRTAVGMVYQFCDEAYVAKLKCLFPEYEKTANVLNKMMDQGINSPYAGTCGRLFDAVSALLNVTKISTFDGEAAIKLSEMMHDVKDPKAVQPYDFEIHQKEGLFEINPKKLLEGIMDDLGRVPVGTIVHKFHETVVHMAVKLVEVNTDEKKNKCVVLSGGSFLNFYLLKRVKHELETLGYEVYTHRLIPPSDGGLSFGQLMVAAAQLKDIQK